MENRKGSIGKHLREKRKFSMEVTKADVAELVDARDLKSLDGNVVWVRVPPPAPSKKRVSRHRTKAAQRDAATSAISPPPAHARCGWPGDRWPATETEPGPHEGYRCWARCNAVSRARTRH